MKKKLFLFFTFLTFSTLVFFKKSEATPNFFNKALTGLIIAHTCNYLYNTTYRNFVMFSGYGMAGTGLYGILNRCVNFQKMYDDIKRNFKKNESSDKNDLQDGKGLLANKEHAEFMLHPSKKNSSNENKEEADKDKSSILSKIKMLPDCFLTVLGILLIWYSYNRL